MPKFRNRGEAASGCIRRWLDSDREVASRHGDIEPKLSARQLRTLRLQIKDAIVRWERAKGEG